MKRIGITGANGILGKTFYDILVSESFYVKKISRDNLNFLDLVI